MRTASTVSRSLSAVFLLFVLFGCGSGRAGVEPPGADRVRELVRAYSEDPVPETELPDKAAITVPWLPILAVFALAAIAAAILGGSSSIGPVGRHSSPEPDREAPLPPKPPSEAAAQSLAALGEFGPACAELYRLCAERAARGLGAEEGRALSRSEIEARVPPADRIPFEILGDRTERFLFGGVALGPSDWDAALDAFRGITWEGTDV